jgi:hypothetical protein
MELFTIFGLTVVMLLFSSIRFVYEHNRLVIFRMGRAVGVRGPGACFVLPIIEAAQRVDMRITTRSVSVKEIVTRDNISCKMQVSCSFQVCDPVKFVTRSDNPFAMAEQAVQAALRALLEQQDLCYLLAERSRISLRMRQVLDRETRSWGIKVNKVELKDVETPDSLQHSTSEFVAVLTKLGKFYLAEGKLHQAEPLLKHSLELSESSLASNDPLRTASLESYALLLGELERSAEYQELESQVEAIEERYQGSDPVSLA